jgi:transforming growth factor-beta-induced protein
VEFVEQNGNVAALVSALGARSTIVQSVCLQLMSLHISADRFPKDLAFTNSSRGGVVQVIDEILIPPFNLTYTLQAFNLTSFEGAAYTAQSDQEFSSTSNVTMFVPANSAFQALGPAISSMSSTELATVLDYHLIEGAVLYSTSLTNGTELTTKQGNNVSITRSSNNLYINSAQVLTSDIMIMNGVLHVIDNVLNPQSSGAQPNTALATQSVVFTDASAVTDLPFTSAIPCSVSCLATAATGSPVSTNSTATATASSSAGTSSSSTGSTKNGLSTGAKAGIAIGVILLLALLVLGALFFLRRNRKVNKATDHKRAYELLTPSNTH